MDTIIRKKRRGAGLTLSQAAKKLKYDIGNLSRIERGVRYPGIPLALKMQRLFGITLEDLVKSNRGGKK